MILLLRRRLTQLKNRYVVQLCYSDFLSNVEIVCILNFIFWLLRMLITIEVHVIILEDLNLITKAKIIALVRVMIRVEYNVTINLIITT